MSCTKAQIVALIAHIQDACIEAGSYEKCLKAIAVIKQRAEEIAISEFISTFY